MNSLPGWRSILVLSLSKYPASEDKTDTLFWSCGFSIRILQRAGESDILSERLYDIDPLFWSKCGYEMKVLAVIMDTYEIKSIDAIITNFHFPHSILLMLISAFAGYDRIMDAYKAAVEKSIDFFVR